MKLFIKSGTPDSQINYILVVKIMGIETVSGLYTCMSVEAFYVTTLLFYIFSEFTI